MTVHTTTKSSSLLPALLACLQLLSSAAAPPDPLNQAVVDWMRTTTNALNAGGVVVNTTRSGPIEYMKRGSGPVVLCMHGGPGGYDQSFLIGEHLIASGFTVIGVSRPGYLRSPLIPGANDTAQLQGDAMIGLLDALGIQKASVLGFSAGSIVAFQMALNYPSRISALVMEGIGVQAADSDFYSFVLALLDDTQDLDALSYGLYFDVYNDDTAMADFLSRDTDLSADAQGRRVAYVAAAQKSFYFRFVNSLLPLRLRRDGLVNDIKGVNAWGDYDRLGLLKKIAVPTLIVQSRNDTSGNHSQAVQIAAQIPASRLISLDDTGHFCWLGKNTDAWEAETGAWLRQTVIPRLSIQRNAAASNINISWTPSVGHLQSAAKIQGPWTTAATNNPAILPLAAANLFFQVSDP